MADRKSSGCPQQIYHYARDGFQQTVKLAGALLTERQTTSDALQQTVGLLNALQQTARCPPAVLQAAICTPTD